MAMTQPGRDFPPGPGATADQVGGANGRLPAGLRLPAAGFERREKADSADAEDTGDLFPRPVRKSDIIYATNQLAVMVDTGISLAVALRGMADQESNPRLKTILDDLNQRVESGEDFSSALTQHPKYFDKTMIALVKSSERTGSLGGMLDQVANYLRKDLENRSKVKAALAYPAVMLFLAIGVTIFLLTYVMPKLSPIFERRGVALPTPTMYLMMLSNSLRDHWMLWLAGMLSAAAGAFWGSHTTVGRQFIDYFRIHAPIIGPMMRKVIISRCLRTLGTMIRGGVSVLEAIRMTAEVAGNQYYEKAWLQVLDQITNGHRISEALQDSPLFPRTLIQMIGSGEETGKLDHVLQRVSSYYDSEVEVSLKTTTSMLEPLMVTVMGVVVGGIGLSLLLPIFSLSRGH